MFRTLCDYLGGGSMSTIVLKLRVDFLFFPTGIQLLIDKDDMSHLHEPSSIGTSSQSLLEEGLLNKQMSDIFPILQFNIINLIISDFHSTVLAPCINTFTCTFMYLKMLQMLHMLFCGLHLSPLSTTFHYF